MSKNVEDRTKASEKKRITQNSEKEEEGSIVCDVRDVESQYHKQTQSVKSN